MNEYIFRGKSTLTKNWYYGDLTSVDVEQSKLVYIIQKGVRICVIPETVGQYVMLTDKNNNMIFDGDIVHCRTTSCSFTGVVEYSKQFARYRVRTKNNCYAMDSCFQYEVIGNIYDNPELMP